MPMQSADDDQQPARGRPLSCDEMIRKRDQPRPHAEHHGNHAPDSYFGSILINEQYPADPESQCVCGHAAKMHPAHSGGCAAMDDRHRRCWCTEFRLSADLPPLERVKIIRAQLEQLQVILSESEHRKLSSEEKRSIEQLREAYAGLAEAFQSLFGQ